jgi:hypothetical protein
MKEVEGVVVVGIMVREVIVREAGRQVDDEVEWLVQG